VNILSRKLTFQLTPLLDLLLIVIFAQYLEVQQASVQYHADLERQADARVATLTEESRHEAARLRAMHAEALDNAQAYLQQRNELERENASLRERRRQQEVELMAALKQAREQRDLVGRLATELFRVPPDLLAKALGPAAGGEGARSPDELADLERQFRALGSQQPDEMVKHLLTFDELRKRCDIWELYIDERGMAIFTAGSHTHEFRVTTAEGFATQLFQRYKALPQPKSLVIILLSYGKARAVWRAAATDGLSHAADRMRNDSGGRSRFEYAILGYRPRGLAGETDE
jgi:hypothetical protein